MTEVIQPHPAPDASDLQESEAKFRALAEGSPDTIMRFDRAHRHVYVNRAVERFAGMPREAFLGRTHREMGFPLDLVELWEQAIDRVFASGEPERVEFVLPTGVWVDWQLAPELSPKGEVRYVMTSARDITERKQAEALLARDRDELERLVAARTAELAASEERYRSLVENLPVGVYRSDPHGRILDANATAVRMLGFSSLEELQQVNVGDLYVARQDRDGHFTRLRSQPTEAAEFELQTRDGRRVWVRDCPRAVLGTDGEVAFCDGVLVDITDRRRDEERLRYLGAHDVLTDLANRASFEEAIAGLAESGPFPVGLVVADVDGLKEVNDRFGHAAGDALLRRTANLLRGSFRPGDLVARIGGDEFAVVLPGADPAIGEAVLVRLRAAIAGQASADDLPLSLSLGLAVATDRATLDDALRLADARMYEEKQRRRNRER